MTISKKKVTYFMMEQGLCRPFEFETYKLNRLQTLKSISLNQSTRAAVKVKQ